MSIEVSSIRDGWKGYNSLIRRKLMIVCDVAIEFIPMGVSFEDF
jgi:hypothetical protein